MCIHVKILVPQDLSKVIMNDVPHSTKKFEFKAQKPQWVQKVK